MPKKEPKPRPKKKLYRIEGSIGLWVEAEVRAATPEDAQELVEAAIFQRLYIDKGKHAVPQVEVVEALTEDRFLPSIFEV